NPVPLSDVVPESQKFLCNCPASLLPTIAAARSDTDSVCHEFSDTIRVEFLPGSPEIPAPDSSLLRRHILVPVPKDDTSASDPGLSPTGRYPASGSPPLSPF